VIKAIRKENKEKWIYRQTKILMAAKDHPNIIKLYGLVMPTEQQEKDGILPSFLFEYL
jgi:hypothetical protein